MRKVVLVTLVAFSACVGISHTVLTPGLTPVPEMSVQIFLPGDSVPPHTRVAILEAGSNDAFNNTTQIFTKLRRAAAGLGADGVMLVGQEAENPMSRALRAHYSGADFGGRVSTRAIAIKLVREE